MWIILYRSFENLSWVEDQPDVPEVLPDSRIEVFDFCIDFNNRDAFEADFISPVDKLCGALIDFDEVEFLNASQCKLLKDWLENKLMGKVNPIFVSVYRKFLEFVTLAVELKTGVDIEL